MSDLLTVDALQAGYGAVPVLHDVCMQVGEGEWVALIGANGAGKSTLLMTLSGLLRATHGRVSLAGRDLAGLPAHAIPGLGLVHCPEGRRIFPRMGVQENLQMGAYGRRATRAAIARDVDAVYALFPILAARRHQPAGNLSGGEQQMLALGRAMLARPQLLLLDEPSLGLAPKVVTQIFAVIGQLNAAGTAILLVEQNVKLALAHARRAYVLERGRIVLSGPAAALRDDPRIRTAYLGGE